LSGAAWRHWQNRLSARANRLPAPGRCRFRSQEVAVGGALFPLVKKMIPEERRNSSLDRLLDACEGKFGIENKFVSLPTHLTVVFSDT